MPRGWSVGAAVALVITYAVWCLAAWRLSTPEESWGVRPRITIWRVLGVGASIIAAVVFLYATWGADGYDVPRHLLPALPFLAVAALVMPPTIPSTSQAANPDRREASVDEH